jgi:protein-L-isoaspartate(D-aspartate) O-methyltransferase
MTNYNTLRENIGMDIELARSNMIEQQIRTWDVLDTNILGLLGELHREDFISDDYQKLAFTDMPIPIGHDQTTMTPKVEARLLQSLKLTTEDSVLEVGTGCGYLTALLAKTAKHVKSIDIYPDFITTAAEKLAKTDLTNVELDSADVYDLLDKSDKYDVVVLTASLPTIDERFMNLLNENGRMFAIVGESPAMEACILTKQGDSYSKQESIFETDLPALIGTPKKETFEF